MSRPKRSPLSPGADLESASETLLCEQMRYELWEIKLQSEATNETLAHELGYKNASSVTKWLNDLAPLSKNGAQALDNLGRKPTVGNSFVELRKAYARASRGMVGRTPQAPRSYDVFLASPMASLPDSEDYKIEREAAKDVKTAIENFCGFTVYYAGDALESQEEFDSPVVAAEENFKALETAQQFVLLAIGEVISRPSSIYVEAGYALAQNLPSLYLVREPDALPFVLRSLNQHQRSRALPRVSVEYVKSKERAVGLVRKHGRDIFTRLNGSSGRGTSAGRGRKRPA